MVALRLRPVPEGHKLSAPVGIGWCRGSLGRSWVGPLRLWLRMVVRMGVCPGWAHRGHCAFVHRLETGESCVGELLKGHLADYNVSRSHLGLEGDCPKHRESETEGRLYAVP